MAEVIFLDKARNTKRNHSRHETAFWRVVNDQLRDDMTKKKELLFSFGNQAVEMREVAAVAKPDTDHIIILFAGAGKLKGFSYSFVVRDEPEYRCLCADILVIENVTGSIFSKSVGWCLTKNYTRRWLNDSFIAALDAVAPSTVSISSTGAVRA